MYLHKAFYITAFAAAAVSAHALEMTAGTPAAQNTLGMEMRLEASNAALTAAINDNKATIATLQATVDTLSNQVKALFDQLTALTNAYNALAGRVTALEAAPSGSVAVQYVGSANTGTCQACGTRNSSVVTADFCMISNLGIGGQGWTRSCNLVNAGNRQWYAQASSNNSNNSMSCSIQCYNVKQQ